MSGERLQYDAGVTLDAALLERMLYVSYFDWLPAGADRPDLDAFVRQDPAVPRWAHGWGRAGDEAMRASIDGHPVGLAWCRLLRADDAGNSFVAEDIPCLAIAVEAAARGSGVGGGLLDRLLALLRAKGYPAITLAVELDNPARRLYPRHGFVPDGERNGYVRMRADLGGAPDT